ncbi:MAG: hypothetical protein KF729_28065, partial [Sandaracinaceae bacterium]|nr:hypothetical protein [Sandaracinaceae bacterium]
PRPRPPTALRARVAVRFAQHPRGAARPRRIAAPARRGRSLRLAALVGAALGAIGCEGAGPAVDAGLGALDGAADDGGGCAPLALAIPGAPRATGAIHASCGATLTLDEARVLDLWVEHGSLTLAAREGAYVGPLRLDAGTWLVAVDRDTTLHVRDLGAPPPAALSIARSLTWTDAALLDDPEVAGLDRVMRAVSGDAPPGRLLDAMFRRFGTTAHSERLGPQRIVEEQVELQGADPAGWDLDALPFRVTGVHNRVDLADGTGCGELRVSLASTHALHQPFHLIFLFAQPARDEDLRPDGVAHCAATALAWARLSALDDAAFRAAARAVLAEALAPARFLVLETVEFIISPWEWRQWFLEGGALENRPLFQTVDTERLNRAGPDRGAFLAWVGDNAAALDARTQLVPERFRAPSARVNDGVPWIALDLGGLAALERYPRLRQQLEIVGCPACHATDAPFVQTLPDRTFSPFYRRELDAREAHLRSLAEGRAPIPAPFGPLQPDPLLPP